MKKIVIPIMLLVFAACGTNKKEVQTVAEKPATQQAAINAEEPKMDGASGATAVPNQVSFNGTIIIPVQAMATVSLTMGGIVKSTSLLPGQSVKQGTVLATIDNPDFITLQQTYLDSHAQVEYLETEYKRQSTLSAEQAASQKRLQQSKADFLSMKSRELSAAAQLKMLGVSPETLLESGITQSLLVKAPISGYVSDVMMNVGKYINAGDALCELVDKSQAMLRLTAYEKDLAKMTVGSRVEFHVNGMDGKVFYASIVSIGQKVDAVTRSVEVFAKMDSVDSLFRPGMYVTAFIKN